MGIQMEIIVRGRHFTVPERFRQHATAKLARLEKLDAKAVRIDVEVSEERNPRQSDHRERVELTIRSRGPAIRAEAAADDRYTALDLAFAKLESRLRRASDRRKVKHGQLRAAGGKAGHRGRQADVPAQRADFHHQLVALLEQSHLALRGEWQLQPDLVVAVPLGEGV